MATPDENNTNGMLNGNGVGIALAAIFVGVALVVVFTASDGAIFGQIFQSAPSNTGPANDSDAGPAEADDEAAVTSRDIFDQGSGDDVSESVSRSDASRTGALPDEEKANSATQTELRQLLTIKNFPWSSVAVEQITSSQNIINKFKQQDAAQQKPAQPELESLFLSDEIGVDVDRDRDDNVADYDRSADVIDILPIDIPVIDDDEQERPDEEQPSDTSDTSEDQQDDSADNEDQGTSEDDSTSNEGESPEEDNSGSGSGDDEEQSGHSGSGSNSTGTQGPSEGSSNESENDGDDGNSTGIEATISSG